MNWTEIGRAPVAHRDSRCGYRNDLAPARRASERAVQEGSASSRRLIVSMNDLSRVTIGLDPVLTASELAAYLGVPVQTIHDLRHGGRGHRGFRIGRELRYRVSEVEARLADLEQSDDLARPHERSRR